MSRCNKPGNFLIRSFCVLLWLQFVGVLPSLGQDFEDRLPTLNELRERFSAAGLILGQEIGALDYQRAGSGYPVQIEDLSNACRTASADEQARSDRFDDVLAAINSGKSKMLMRDEVDALEGYVDLFAELCGADHVITASQRRYVASRLMNYGFADRAIPLIADATETFSRVIGPDHPEVAMSLNGLGTAYGQVGRLEEAEVLLKHAYTLAHAYPFETQNVQALTALDLAIILIDAGDVKGPKPLLEEAMAVANTSKDGGNEIVARAMQAYAGLASASGQPFDVVNELYDEACTTVRRVFGAGHKLAGTCLMNATLAYEKHGRFALSERYLEMMKEARQLTNPLSYEMASVERRLGENRLAQGKYKQAITNLENAVELFGFVESQDSANAAIAKESLARAYLADGQSQPALHLIRRTIAGAANENAPSETVSPWDRTGSSIPRSRHPHTHARAAYEFARSGGGEAAIDQPSALLAEGFEAAQLIDTSRAAEALAKAAARRTAPEGSELGRLAREFDALNEHIAKLDESFVEAVTAGEQGAEQRETIAAKRSASEVRIAEIEKVLAERYPQFFELIQPQAVSLAELQAQTGAPADLLRDDEVLILITPGRSWWSRHRWNGLVWAVSKDGAAWAEISKDDAALRSALQSIRGSLDPGLLTRAPDLGISSPSTPQRAYDRAAARAIYDALFADPEIAALVSGKSDWIIVPQGAFVGIPFNALVTGPYDGADSDPVALRATPWLGTRKAISVLPSVSSLNALRVLERPARDATKPFFGLGDPVFTGTNMPEDVERSRTGGIDLQTLSELSPLPATRDEIRSMARTYGVETQEGEAYLLGAAASESGLRSASRGTTLPKARVVAFATHGLLHGEFDGLAEPALALTPPTDIETNENDGLLTASEAASLELSADWVILSACNTSAGDKGSSEGLTGLARAFFYAGADGLLVSNWRVQDRAAERLTTAVIQYTDSEGLSRAEALQRSMTDLMNDTSRDKAFISNAHPATWSPFMFVGVDE